jgi:hypothetical protein
MPGNVHIPYGCVPHPLRASRQTREKSAGAFCGADFADSLQGSCMACREMAMSELRQQMLALWILLMLLLMVPWVLE